MMRSLLRRPAARAADERGVALVIVLVVMVVASGLVATSVTYASRSTRPSRHAQDWNAALAAAEAGIDDYLTRLNANDTYGAFNSVSNPDTSNPAMVRDGQPLPAFRTIPGGTGGFRYRVDTSVFNTTGVIKVVSTGNANDVRRTVAAELRRDGFIDYLYFTDLETSDPLGYSQALKTFIANRGHPPDYCAVRHWQRTQAQRDFCDDGTSRSALNGSSVRNLISIRFAASDVINGPLHSNDAMRMDPTTAGPRFLGNVTTRFNQAPRWLRTDGSLPATTATPRPQFARTGDPAYTELKTMPATNEKLRQDAIAGGCLFTGPTSIELLPPASAGGPGRMRVTSPFTRDTNPGEPTACFRSSSGIATATILPLPTNGVLYVQDTPTASGDPNRRTSCGVSGTPAHPLRYPYTTGSTATTEVATYGCLAGDLFIEGTLKGQLTAAAQNNVVIVWHLRYQDGTSGSDVLGLIANNNVEVYHPVNSSNANINYRSSGCPGSSPCAFVNPVINAAILTLHHSFTVQNFRSGATLGTLNVNGSMSQKFRGPVGTGTTTSISTGYAKNYVYDERLRFQSPPRFLEPVDSPWNVIRWEERRNT